MRNLLHSRPVPVGKPSLSQNRKSERAEVRRKNPELRYNHKDWVTIVTPEHIGPRVVNRAVFKKDNWLVRLWNSPMFLTYSLAFTFGMILASLLFMLWVKNVQAAYMPLKDSFNVQEDPCASAKTIFGDSVYFAGSPCGMTKPENIDVVITDNKSLQTFSEGVEGPESMVDVVCNPKYKWDCARMMRIAFAESSYNNNAIHKNRDGSWDYCLLQINSIHGYSQAYLSNIHNCVEAGYKLYLQSGYQPWASSKHHWK